MKKVLNVPCIYMQKSKGSRQEKTTFPIVIECDNAGKTMTVVMKNSGVMIPMDALLPYFTEEVENG